MMLDAALAFEKLVKDAPGQKKGEANAMQVRRDLRERTLNISKGDLGRSSTATRFHSTSASSGEHIDDGKSAPTNIACAD